MMLLKVGVLVNIKLDNLVVYSKTQNYFTHIDDI